MKRLAEIFFRDDKTGEWSDTTIRTWAGYLFAFFVMIVLLIFAWIDVKVPQYVIDFIAQILTVLLGSTQVAYSFKRYMENRNDRISPLSPPMNGGKEDATAVETKPVGLYEITKWEYGVALIDRLKRYAKANYGNVNFDNWVMFAIRGAYIKEGGIVLNDNEIDKYNDSFVLIKGDSIKTYEASIDPGLHWIKNPMSKGGAAQVQKGIYKYKLGKHKGKPAFNQASKIKVMRDKDGNGIWQDEPIEEGYFGINIHWSWTLDKVGKDSAGCMVLKSKQNGTEWKDFFNTLAPQKEFYVIVMDGESVNG